MNANHPARIVLLATFLLLLQAGCEQRAPEPPLERIVTTRSPADLFAFFDETGYTAAAWNAGIREIPRITLASIPKRWQTDSEKLPVAKKKELFFRLAAPAILLSNERIEKERKLLEHLGGRFPDLTAEENEALAALARKYKVPPGDGRVKAEQLEELALRVDTIPPSLAMAQAAEESGWGTSRFAVLGNAIFGQWDFSGKGMIPERQRKELGKYGLARFDSPQDSVEAYMLNLNTHRSYAALRTRRAEMRRQGQKPTGHELAKTLDKYSERREEYVKALHALMRINHLDEADDAKLWAKGTIRIEPLE